MHKSMQLTSNNAFHYNRSSSDHIEKVYLSFANKSLPPKIQTTPMKNVHSSRIVSKGIFGPMSLQSSSKYPYFV